VFITTTRRILLITLVQSLIFTQIVSAEQLTLPSSDMTAPQISHTPIHGTVKEGTKQKISAKVTDDSGVKSVTLFYREVGAVHYERMPMQRSLDSNNYDASIKIPELGVEYYIQAEDKQGNTVLNGYSFSPFTINVAAAGTSTGGDTGSSQNVFSGSESKESGSKMKWVWIGLGVLAAGALASGGGGGGGGSNSGKSGTTVTVDGPLP